MALQHSPSIVTSGLVLCLDAASPRSYPGSGTAWYDSSGNGNTGTLVNGPTYNSANLGSIVFDGVDDYASIANSAVLRPANQLTVCMWAKAISITAGWNALFGQSPYTGAYLIFLETGGTLIRALHNVNGTEYRCNTNQAISTSVYTHIVFTFSTGDAIRSYFNGVASTTTALPAGTFTYNTSNPFLIGYPGANYFNGNISTAQIYNRALSATEVTQNFNAYRGRYGV